MALSRERNTPMIGDGLVRSVAVKAAVKIYAGALVVANGGYAAPGSAALSLVALGRAEETIDNTNGANGAVSVRVRRGIFPYRNKGDDAVLVTDIGALCYVVDDETVARTSATNTRSAAGKVWQVEGDQVWVEFT